LINVGPKFESPLTFQDEHVKLFLIVVISLPFKDDKQVVLFNVVKLKTFNDDEYVTALLNVVYPATYCNVFIETPLGFKRIVSQYLPLVFNNMLLKEGEAMVKSPTLIYILFLS
jgi:hypothetical protein